VTGETTNGMCRGTSGLSKVLEEEGRSLTLYITKEKEADCDLMHDSP